MNNLDNPYSGIINIMREQGAKNNAPNIMLGRVVRNSPLLIQVGDIQLDKDNLYVADYLMPNYKRNLKTSFNLNLVIDSDTSEVTLESVSIGDQEHTFGSHNHGSHKHSFSKSINKTIEINNAAYFTDSGLKIGDMVAIQQLQGLNKFIVYCKVV